MTKLFRTHSLDKEMPAFLNTRSLLFNPHSSKLYAYPPTLWRASSPRKLRLQRDPPATLCHWKVICCTYTKNNRYESIPNLCLDDVHFRDPKTHNGVGLCRHFA
jgi:hypothetical protein